MKDITTKSARVRLANSIKASDRILGPFRENRRKVYERMTNAWMPGATAREYWRLNTPVNLIDMAMGTYTTRLVARNPKVSIVPRSRGLQAEARELQIAVNMLIGEIDLRNTIRSWVRESLVSVGVVKVGLVPPEHDEMRGAKYDGGQPFCDPVFLDDFLFDPSARSWDQADFFADRYRVPVELVRNSPLVEKKRLDELKGDGERQPQGTSPSERMDMQDALLGSAISGDGDEAVEYLWLVDVYLPRKQVIETYLWASGEIQGEPLWTTEWEGPERGPYHLLSFGEIPGTLLPFPPAATWVPMHDAVNALWRKVIHQALRQKNILGVWGDGQDDGERISKAADGDAVGLTTRDKVEELRFGGPDNQIIGTTATMMQIFNRAAGNLDALGGLGPSSGTVGQDRIITEQASERLRDMQTRLHQSVKGVVEALADMEYSDPIKERTITKRVGVAEIESNYGPERREADFREFNMDVVPYSMEDKTPQERAQTLRELMGELVQLQPMLEQLGGTLRVDEYIKKLGELYDEPVLADDLVDFAEPSIEGKDGGSRGGAPPPNTTTRRYERVSRAGPSTQSPEEQLAQQMLAGGGGER